MVGIEEPEAALHPAAAGVLLGALREASEATQVLVTSHSPDLLDHKGLGPEHLLAVTSDATGTSIGPVDAAVRSILRDKLYSPGELLSQGPIEPDVTAVSASTRQMRLFDNIEE